MHGNAMFLIEGSNGAVLHTGDFRAEKLWCDSLIRNPAIQRYISWNRRDLDKFGEIEVSGSLIPKAMEDTDWAENFKGKGKEAEPKPQDQEPSTQSSSSTVPTSSKPELSDMSLRLKNIYLDTEMLPAYYQVMSKQRATEDLVSLLRYFPSEALIFLDSWTWGYEDMLKGVAKAFGTPIHVDRYKASMYGAFKSEDPFLDFVVTNEKEVKFHACERFKPCHLVEEARKGRTEMGGGKTFLVWVNAVESSVEAWENYFPKMEQILKKARDGKGPWPTEIVSFFSQTCRSLEGRS